MHKRIWILATLIAIALLTRALDAYEILVRPTSLLEPMGFNFTIENNRMTVISMDSADPSGQPTRVQEAGLRKNDQILAVYNARGEGQSIDSMFDFGEVMRTVGIGEPLTLVVLRDSHQPKSQELSLHLPQARRSTVGWSLLWGLGVVLPMVSILTAAFIGFLKAEDDNALLASLLFLCFSSLSIHAFFLFPSGLRVLGMIYQTSLAAFLPYLIMRFFLLFPSPSLIERKMPWLRTVFLACTLVSWVVQLTGISAACFSFKRYQQVNAAIPQSRQVLLGLTSAMFVYHRPGFIDSEYGNVQEQRRKTAHGDTADGSVGRPAASYHFRRIPYCLRLRAVGWMGCSGVLYARAFSSFICLCGGEASGFRDSFDPAARVTICPDIPRISGRGSYPDLLDL